MNDSRSHADDPDHASLTPDQWRRAQEHFHRASQLLAEARQDYLDRCQDDTVKIQVLKMIAAADSGTSFLDQPAVELAVAAARNDGVASDRLLARIGHYAIVEEIGRGGMGTVYLAHRVDDYHQEVALKLLRRGLDTDDIVERFRTERQILANLDHPSITKLLDGGATDDGRPYLVMEHVDGVPITSYCRQHQNSITERLRLFRQVCAAVQLAHQNLVVHRDLKPSNILVSADGIPKLLDFGIAKLISADGFAHTILETQPGSSAPLTPAYASPEQLRGKPVTTASDVYALGIVLFELLTGSRPPEPTTGSTAQTDSSGSSSKRKPSAVMPALRRHLAGDLDTIVMVATHEDPSRRYSTAEQLMRDLDRHLANRPISACPDTFGYRAGKFLRRNTSSVILAAIAATALVAFTIALAMTTHRAKLNRYRSDLTLDLLIDFFEVPDPTRSRGSNVTARELLESAIPKLENRLSDQPAMLARMQHVIGRTYKNLGLYPEASRLFESAACTRLVLRNEHAAESLQALADVRSLEGDYAGAERWTREALDLLTAKRETRDPTIADGLMRLARIAELRGNFDAAEANYEDALRYARRIADDRRTAAILGRYAGCRARRRPDNVATAMFLEALALLERAVGDDHPEVALLKNDHALLAQAQSDYPLATRLLAEAEASQRQLFDGAHPNLATTLNNQGLLLRAEGKLSDAEARYESSLSMLRDASDEHPNLAATLTNLADLRIDQGRTEVAEALYREALQLRRRILGEDHPDVAESLNNLGRLLCRRGDLPAAQKSFDKAHEIVRKRLGEQHPLYAIVKLNLGKLAESRGDLDAAKQLITTALAIQRRVLGEQHPATAASWANLGDVERRSGQLDAAAKAYHTALEINLKRLGPDHPAPYQSRIQLAQLHLDLGAPENAEALARAANDFYAKSAPPTDPWRMSAEYFLGLALFDQERFAEAEPWLRATYDRLSVRPGPTATPTRDVAGRLATSYRQLGRPEDSLRFARLAKTEP